jgi:hypothetical protein
MTLINRDDRSADLNVNGDIVHILRDIQEMQSLAMMCTEHQSLLPILAAQDGTLIKWSFESQKLHAFFIEELLHNGYIKSLWEMKYLDEKSPLLPCGYISNSGSRDVVNMLKVAICNKPQSQCEKYCTQNSPRPCASLDCLVDRDIFNLLLKEGQRSACFDSLSKINDHYGLSRINFFYLKTNGEISRLEIPQWLRIRKEQVDLLHTLLLDQCFKGEGYPVCLTEAHEQAVVTRQEADTLEQILKRQFIDKDLTDGRISLKALSKKSRHL